MSKFSGILHRFMSKRTCAILRWTASKFMISIAVSSWLVACRQDNIFHFEIKNLGGNFLADSVAEFKFLVEDTNKVYRIKSVLFYTNAYPYSNLYVRREIYYEGKLEYSDTANYILFDEFGKMTGKGFSGVKKLENTIGKGPLRFMNVGFYTVELSHIMRQDTLPGIEKIGILITEENQ